MAGAIALTTLTLNAKWFSEWSSAEKGHRDDVARVVAPNGEIKSVACSADGKTVFVGCHDVWTKGPDGAGRGKVAKDVLFKSTDGGDTWMIMGE
jgi:hypothetical protein